jgi:hypothetical protein
MDSVAYHIYLNPREKTHHNQEHGRDGTLSQVPHLGIG